MIRIGECPGHLLKPKSEVGETVKVRGEGVENPVCPLHVANVHDEDFREPFRMLLHERDQPLQDDGAPPPRDIAG